MAGCGVKASGVQECRQIERARCESAAACGIIEDVAACERYVEDQCRHGFPPDLGPSNSSVAACVKAIQDVGVCAERSGKKTAPGDCGRSSLSGADADRVCELVEHPESIPRCDFLAEAASADEDSEDAAAEPEKAEEEEAETAVDAGADAAR